MSRPTFAPMPAGVQEKSLDVNGLLCTYWEIGEGKPVILTHGGGPGSDGISNWYLVMPLLAERGYRVISTNLLGFGATDYPDPGYNPYPKQPFVYDVEGRARHLLGYLDALEIDEGYLVGNSLGGVASLGVCMLAPERVRRLALVGPGGLPFDRQNPIFTTGASFAREPTLDNMKRIVQTLNGGLAIPDLNEQAKYRFELTRHPGVQKGSRGMTAVARHPEAPGGLDLNRVHVLDEGDLERIMTPTLLVCGREDEVTTLELGCRAHRILQNSWLVSLPQSGHWTMIRYPEAFVDLCTWFFETHALVPSAE